MSRLKISLALSCLVLVVGCNQWNSFNKRLNSTGQSHTATKPVLREESSSTVMAFHTPTVEVHQGETKSINASIERKANSDGDVELRFSDVPQGVSFEPSQPVIKRHEIEGRFSVVTSSEVPAGEHIIRVIAHPRNGEADFFGQLTLKITRQE